MPYKDIEQRRIHSREYYHNHKELFREKDKRRKRPPEYKEQHDMITRKSYLKQKYGLTVEAFEEMLMFQNGVCAICHRAETINGFENLSVDHDHKTGEIRGLLCHSCNVGLGKFQDDPLRLEKAIEYLRRFRC